MTYRPVLKDFAALGCFNLNQKNHYPSKNASVSDVALKVGMWKYLCIVLDMTEQLSILIDAKALSLQARET